MIDIITLPIVVENKNIYRPNRLSNLVAQRSRQIIQLPTCPKDTKYEKAATISLEELLEEKVFFVSGKLAKRVRTEELKTRVRIAKKGELVNEIKMKLSANVEDSGIIEPNAD